MRIVNKILCFSLFFGVAALYATAQTPITLWSKDLLGFSSFGDRENELKLTYFGEGGGVINETIDLISGQATSSQKFDLNANDMSSLLLRTGKNLLLVSPDKKYRAVIEKTGPTLIDNATDKVLRKLPKSGSDTSGWFYISEQWLLRSDDGKVTLVSTVDGSERILKFSSKLSTGGVIRRVNATYLVTGSYLVKVDPVSGDVLWKSAEMPLTEFLSGMSLVEGLLESNSGLVVVAGMLERGDGWTALKNNRVYQLDASNGTRLKPPFATKVWSLGEIANDGERVFQFRELGDGMIAMESSNLAVIDLNTGKELWATGRYSGFRDSLYTLVNEGRYFPPTFVSDGQYTVFDFNGGFTRFDVKTGKVITKGKLGVELDVFKEQANTYRLVGNSGKKGALLELDRDSLKTIRKFEVSNIVAMNNNESGTIFVTGDSVNVIPTAGEQYSIKLPTGLVKPGSSCLGVNGDGTMAWLCTSKEIIQVSLENKKIDKVTPWNLAGYFGTSDAALSSARIQEVNNTLVLATDEIKTRGLISVSVKGVIVAFNLATGTVTWSTKEVIWTHIFPKSNVIVYLTGDKLEDRKLIAVQIPSAK